MGASKRLHRCPAALDAAEDRVGVEGEHADNVQHAASTEEASFWWYRYTPDADGDGVPDAIQNMTGQPGQRRTHTSCKFRYSKKAPLVPTMVASVRLQVCPNARLWEPFGCSTEHFRQQ